MEPPARPRFSDESPRCPTCGWFCPPPPAAPICTRCSARAVRLDPLTAREKLYLAAVAFRARKPRDLREDRFWEQAVELWYQQDGGGETGATPLEIRRRLRERADAWRVRGCPV